MKKSFIILSISFLVAISAFGQNIMISPSILSLQSTDVGDVGISAYRANNGGLPVTSGRVLFSIHARGEAGATPNIPNARIIIAAEENFTATSRATGISFDITKPNSNIFQRAMRLSSKGFLAIGNLTPNAPLQFENIISNRKIVMVEQADNDHEFTGFGVGGGIRYQIPHTTEAHIFYAGTSASSSNELMRVQGNGNVGIGTNNTTDARLNVVANSSKGLVGSSVSNIGVQGLSVSSVGVNGQSDNGIGVSGSSPNGTGIRGFSGSGSGVIGISNSSNGFYGNNNSVGTATALFENQASGGNALQIQGGIKVSGSSPAALRLTANTDVFSLPVPITSANTTDDLLFVTRATGTGGGTSTSYYAKWTGSDWEIRREDSGTITAGTLINVLVIKQ
ncbi:MAG TPA: hypothetical protein VK175_10280 [Leadbetterella sp.]|nr:hypothetical protein [Leadbetterella sp.]